MYYFHNLSSASGGFDPYRDSIPWPRRGSFIPGPLICPSLAKILRAPMSDSAHNQKKTIQTSQSSERLTDHLDFSSRWKMATSGVDVLLFSWLGTAVTRDRKMFYSKGVKLLSFLSTSPPWSCHKVLPSPPHVAKWQSIPYYRENLGTMRPQYGVIGVWSNTPGNPRNLLKIVRQCLPVCR